MRRFVALAALLLALAPAANAADKPNPTLDTVAAYVAGHPTHVYCEDSWAEWLSFGSPEANGFTYANQTQIWIAPKECETLSAWLNGADVGTYYASDALLTLAHEGVHQRGVTSEAAADCTALRLVPTLATKFFHVPVTVPVKVYRVVKGKLRVHTKHVANPWLARLVRNATTWHKMKPAQYQGGC